MKVGIFILLYILTSETTALTLKKIEGIDHLVQELNFDSDGNIYAFLTDYVNRHEFYKINSTSKEIVWKQDYPATLGVLWDSLVTSQNEFYLSFLSAELQRSPIAVFHPDTRLIQLIEEDNIGTVFRLDGNENLLYLKEDNIIYMLKRNSVVPIPVENLEHVFVTQPDNIEIDEFGNFYFGFSSGEVAVLRYEAQQEAIPSASFVYDPNPDTGILNDITIDGNGTLWFVADGTFKKLINDRLEITFTDENYLSHRMVSAKDKIFVIAKNGNSGAIYYLTLNGDIVRIPELENINIGEFFVGNRIADSEGNAYFYPTSGVFSQSLGSMILIDSGGKVVPIDFGVGDWNVDFVTLDFDENVWIKLMSDPFLTVGIYRLKKGETIPEKVNTSEGCRYNIDDVHVNWVTREIYVSCTDGLYVVVSD